MTIKHLLLSLITLSMLFAPRPNCAAEQGRFAVRFDASKGVVEVSGLNDSEIKALSTNPAPNTLASVLIVRVATKPDQPQASPIVGKYELADKKLQFIPRYPFVADSDYEAEFHPSSLGENVTPYLISFHVKPKGQTPPTTVVAVYPTSDVLPENQLKLYVQFSGPMSRGEAYRRVRVRADDGDLVERPFLELGEELWNPEMTRLTLLFDPGRIKRGLKPREEEGPILESGKRYSFEIDPAWRDASNRPLIKPFRKNFRASAPDETQPNPKNWRFEPGKIGSRDPLVIHVPEPLDAAMLQHAIRVEAAGQVLAGRTEVGAEEASWRFSPDQPWPDGELAILVNPELEDRAGNSVARPFEVDAVREGSVPNSTKPLRYPIPRERSRR